MKGMTMGIVTKEVKTKWNNMNKSWLMSKGYNYTYMGDSVEVKLERFTKRQFHYYRMRM